MNKSILQLMDEIEWRTGVPAIRWELLRDILSQEADPADLLSLRKNGQAHALKLIESNIKPTDDGIKIMRPTGYRVRGVIPYPVLDVYEDKS